MATVQEMAKGYYDEARNCLVTSDIKSGLDYLHSALELCRQTDDKMLYVKILDSMCIGYSLSDQLYELMQTILDGLKYCNDNKILGAKHFFYTNITNKYLMLKDYPNAVNYGLLAANDLEEFGDKFETAKGQYMITYLNLAYAYIKCSNFIEAEKYLDKSMIAAKEADIHSHDFTFKCAEATIQHLKGNDSYVTDHKDELMDFFKNVNVTLEDYVQDIQILIDLFCDMKLFDDALAVALALEKSSLSQVNSKIRLEIYKIYMQIYKEMNDKENYSKACISYATADMEIQKNIATQNLMDMDTAIALSIATSSIDI